MKEIIPEPVSIVRNQAAAVRELFQKHVVPSYARFDLAFTRGAGSYLWDVHGKRYLDFGGGIAVCALGHAPSAITEALVEQSRTLVHVSNLYYHEPQGRLAQALCRYAGAGKVFFSNSGAEANEGLFKLARKFGHDEGRFEILTALNSFHGRTLAGIAATGQEKVKKGFDPLPQGFRHVPFNDLAAIERALSPATAAVLIEPIQGESGVRPVSAEFLGGLRTLCDEKRLLLLVDEVQCGHFRTGHCFGYQQIIEGSPVADSFKPDGISMAKSLGGGFPIGAFWVREPYQDVLGPGTHASTFGGTPLGCAVALKILEVIEKHDLAANAREQGAFLVEKISRLIAEFPSVLKEVRGFGLMIGIELAPQIQAFGGSAKTPAIQMIDRLHDAGLLAIPAGTGVFRLLPALNLSRAEALEGFQIIEHTVAALAHS